MRESGASWPSLLAGAAWAVILAGGLAVAAAAPAQQSDALDQLRSKVTSYEVAWNTHQASAVAEFYTEDADMIFGNGKEIDGREAIEAWWNGYFEKIEDARGATFTIRSMRSITQDVALINIDSTTSGRGAAGTGLSTRLARGTWVMVRRDAAWKIAALRAQPAEGDVRGGPGEDLPRAPASGRPSQGS